MQFLRRLASFQFESEDISFFTIALNEHPNINLQNPRQQCYQTVPRRERGNFVWWSHTWEIKLSESFSLVIMWGYFLFLHLPLWAPKYHFAESSTTVLANCSKKGSVELCVLKSPMRKQSLRKLPSGSYVRILLFSPWAPMFSQISLCRIHDNSVSKLLQKRRVELLVMKSHIRKQSLRKLISSYYVRIFPFSQWDPMGSQISLCKNPRQQC